MSFFLEAHFFWTYSLKCFKNRLSTIFSTSPLDHREMAISLEEFSMCFFPKLQPTKSSEFLTKQMEYEKNTYVFVDPAKSFADLFS